MKLDIILTTQVQLLDELIKKRVDLLDIICNYIFS